MKKISKKIFTSFLFLFFITACSPIVTSMQPVMDTDPKKFHKENSFGQTFYSKNDGLNGIGIFIGTVEKSGVINLRLFDSFDMTELIAESEITLGENDLNQYVFFQFDRPVSSLNKDFYFVIETEDAVCSLGNSTPSTYSWGSMYKNGKPVENQFAFSVSYNLSKMAFGVFVQILIWLFWIFIICLAFLFPGIVLFRIFWKQRLSLAEELGIAAGLSVSVYPLILLWTNVTGVHLFAWNGIIPIVLALVYLVYHIWKNRKLFAWTEIKNRYFGNKEKIWVVAGYCIVLAGVILSRFWAIRSLEAPLWGDSVQHSVIAQLILDHGGLFENWMPYTPYQTLTVQYGFPANTAIFSWLSGYTSLYSTLIFGQIANIFAIMSIYPLALKVSGKKPWVGIISMLVAGLLLPMPAFYVNWGRFAQLAGQVVLPIAVWAMWECLEDIQEISWKKLFFAAITFSGMCLNYYRMPFYYATFILALSLMFVFVFWKKNLVYWKNAIIKFIGVILLSIAFLIPWVINVMDSSLAESVEAGITTSIPLNAVINDFQIYRSIKDYVPELLLFLSGVTLLISLVKQEWKVLTIFFWSILLSGYKAGMVLNLPGANMMQSFAVVIALYLPVSILISWLSGYLIEKIPELRWKQTSIFLIIMIFTFWGTNQLRKIVDEPMYSMIKNPDLFAMEWIKENIPEDAKFLVEGFRIYNGNSIVGSDGGWYLPLLTKRQNTIPPQYALLNEVPIDENYSQHLVDMVAYLEDHSLSEKETLHWLCKSGISHIYIGQDQGEVGVGENQLFNQNEIPESFYNLIYAQDRVRIYEVKQQLCQN
jgi:hypothetical protein